MSSSITSATNSQNNEIFQATSIDQGYFVTTKKVLKAALKVIFFPITLIQYGANRAAFLNGVGSPDELKETRDITSIPYTKVQFRTEDGLVLEGRHFVVDRTKPTMLVCRGSHQATEFYNETLIEELHKLDYNVLLFNYRGFGNSEGQAYSDKDFYKDGEAAFQYLNTGLKIAEEKIVVWGYSMGGGVAVDLAKRHNQAGLVLDKTFTNMRDVAYEEASKILPIIGVFVGYLAYFIFWFGNANFSVSKHLNELENTVFFVKAKDDKITSESAFKNIENSFQPHEGKNSLRVEGRHLQTCRYWLHNPDYRAQIAAAFEKKTPPLKRSLSLRELKKTNIFLLNK